MSGKYTDLERMTFLELLEEKVKVKATIADLIAQKRVSGRPDDRLYRAWLRKTNLQLSTQVARHDQIKLLLAKRQADPSVVKRQPKPAASMPTPEQAVANAARKARLQEALHHQTPDMLLLKAYRVIRHLLVDGDELPATLDLEDRDTLGQLALHLREQFGRENVNAAMTGSQQLAARVAS